MKPIAKIVIDANALLSILIGGAAARRILMHPHAPVLLYVTPYVRREVEEYIPILATRKKLDESLLWSLWNTLPLIEMAAEQNSAAWNRAAEVMGNRDPDDVPTLAVALKYAWPVWSQDRDFEEARMICSVYTTSELLHILDSNE